LTRNFSAAHSPVIPEKVLLQALFSQTVHWEQSWFGWFVNQALKSDSWKNSWREKSSSPETHSIMIIENGKYYSCIYD